MKYFLLVILVGLISLPNIIFALPDPSTGEIDDGVITTNPEVIVPANFNVDEATAALKQARISGDKETAAAISSQLNAWWLSHRVITPDPQEAGYNPNPNPGPQPIESYVPPQNPQPCWGTDVRISPNSNQYGVKIASLSTGELYAFSVYYDGSAYHGIVNRSTDNGQNWSVYWDNTFSSGMSIFDPYLYVVKDTLIESYILHQTSNSTYRTWFRVCLPGGSDNPIFYGSPTGSFAAIQYSDLRCTSDNAVYPTDEYLYATWAEVFGTTPDSSRVRFARSNELNVGTWEIAPVTLRASSNGAYYLGERIAYGSSTDRMWIVNWLHPIDYPGTFDRQIRGWYSNNYGSTWNTTPVDITSPTDNLDQTGPSIAGSHINTNWSCLYQQADEQTGTNPDIYNAYSLNDTTWTLTSWVVPYTEFLPDIWVDDASTGFYAALRQDVGSGDEEVKYKRALITNPNSWTGSVKINDNTANLSSAYGPSVTRNISNGDAVIAWTDYFSSNYSIWMDAESWTGIEEGTDTKPLAKLALNVNPNPTRGASRLAYTVNRDGHVRIAVYDASGRLVTNLFNGDKKAGTYTASLNVNLPGGVYFVRMDTPTGSVSNTMTVVK